MEQQPNQIYRSLLGVVGLNFAAGYDSSSRQQMFSSQIGQLLVFEDSSERRIQTGLEREFGKYTFSIKMPVDGMIVKIIHLYRDNYGQDSINYNPHSIIIYEDANTKEYGVIEVPRYCTNHQHFGFNYRHTPEYNALKRGSFVKKGTILLDSPSVNSQGGYQYGRECNVAFVTHPSIAEDGIIISRDMLPKFAYKQYETRIIEFGNKLYPLNLYGDDENYRPFPEIGQYIRDDGLLAAMREYDPTLAVVEQNIHGAQEVDFTFDRLVYGAGPGGRVIDIRVEHDPGSTKPTTPTGMEAQVVKYDRARRVYYEEILETYRQLIRARGEDIVLTPNLHRHIIEAISVLGEGALHPNRSRSEREPNIIKEYRRNPLDDWRVTIVLEYTLLPDVGSKFSDSHGFTRMSYLDMRNTAAFSSNANRSLF